MIRKDSEKPILVESTGAQTHQAGEHPNDTPALLLFDYECYPEAKILSGAELAGLKRLLGRWETVAEEIGASEAFVRQNAAKVR